MLGLVWNSLGHILRRSLRRCILGALSSLGARRGGRVLGQSDRGVANVHLGMRANRAALFKLLFWVVSGFLCMKTVFQILGLMVALEAVLTNFHTPSIFLCST